LIRDVFALAFVGSMEVNIALLLYDMQRRISAIVGEIRLGMLHVNFFIAVVGLHAIFGNGHVLQIASQRRHSA
jgi:hypothetical protein